MSVLYEFAAFAEMSCFAAASGEVAVIFSASPGVANAPPRTQLCVLSPGHAYSPVTTLAPMPALFDEPCQPSSTGRLIPS